MLIRVFMRAYICLSLSPCESVYSETPDDFKASVLLLNMSPIRKKPDVTILMYIISENRFMDISCL